MKLTVGGECLKRFPAACAALVLLLCGCGDIENSETAASEAQNSKTNTGVITAPPQTAPTTTSTTAATTAEDPNKPKPKGWVLADGFTVSDQDKFNEYLCELEELASKLGDRAGFYYENMVTHATLQYNSYKKFFTASTIKAPYVKYLLEEGVDLDEKIKLGIVWSDGDASIGQLVPSDAGKEFTVRTLIDKTITLSDNSAYNNLVQRFGVDGFNTMQAQIKTSATISRTDIFPSACAIEQARFYRDIYEFAEKNENGKWLIDLLSDCETNMQIGRALGSKYKVAQKYGAEYDFNPQTFNDCAVVYAEKPFVLCILTEQPPEQEESSIFFQKLAVLADNINSLIV
jgi:beta-lactamase class A